MGMDERLLNGWLSAIQASQCFKAGAPRMVPALLRP